MDVIDQPLHHSEWKYDRASLDAAQFQQLRSLIAEIDGRNPFWTKKWEAAGLERGNLHSLLDLSRFPLTTKAELIADQQAHPPYGSNLTYPRARYSRLHQTSGTTGHPMRWLDTPTSWGWVLDCWQQLFAWIGLEPTDRLFFPFSFGPFLGFWAGFEGANRLGNLCIAAGGMSTEARLGMLLDNEVTVVCCTPTYALRLAEVAREKSIDLAGSPVRFLLVAGEPGGAIPTIRQRLEQAWGARIVDHWGMTELGPMAIECPDEPSSLRLLETACIPEIIDPNSGTPVECGQEGELVITTLGRVGSPLIRYRTGDRVIGMPTATGTNQCLRLAGGIRGRIDEMLTIRGNNVYPSALEEILRGYSQIVEYRITLREERAMQQLQIEFEPRSELDATAIRTLTQQLEETFRRRFHFRVEVVPVAIGSLPRFEMKARRFVIAQK